MNATETKTTTREEKKAALMDARGKRHAQLQGKDKAELLAALNRSTRVHGHDEKSSRSDIIYAILDAELPWYGR